jgi:hypothetical protein
MVVTVIYHQEVDARNDERQFKKSTTEGRVLSMNPLSLEAAKNTTIKSHAIPP